MVDPKPDVKTRRSAVRSRRDMPDEVARFDTLPFLDGRSDRFIADQNTADVFDGHDRPIHDHAGEVDPARVHRSDGRAD